MNSNRWVKLHIQGYDRHLTKNADTAKGIADYLKLKPYSGPPSDPLPIYVSADNSIKIVMYKAIPGIYRVVVAFKETKDYVDNQVTEYLTKQQLQ